MLGSRYIKGWRFCILVGLFPAAFGESLLSKERGKEKSGPVPSTEERLVTVEDRLDRLEAGLAMILEKLSGLADDKAGISGSGESIDNVAAEAESLGEAVSKARAASQSTTAAQKSPYNTDEPTRLPYGGYMEMHVNHDNINPTVLDLHRFVLLFGHEFNQNIRFVGELEIEHGLVEGGEESGEVEIEQAYLDFLLLPNLSFRAGQMLTPVGIVNERHEPAAFFGVERPFVDTVIIPTTWFAQGAGLVGDLGKGFSFKLMATSSLNAAFFSADEGFRDGRQKGFSDTASHLATVGRLEYSGVPDLDLGVSYWVGNTGFEFELPGRAQIFEFDGEYDWRRFELRGLFAITDLNDAAEINRAVQRRFGVNPNIAERMRGFYLESAVHVLSEGFGLDLAPFYRYENYDTQFGLPEGFLPLNQFDRSAHVVGFTLFPHPDIAIKFDYNFLNNASEVVKAFNRWNIGFGWWF